MDIRKIIAVALANNPDVSDDSAAIVFKDDVERIIKALNERGLYITPFVSLDLTSIDYLTSPAPMFPPKI